MTRSAPRPAAARRAQAATAHGRKAAGEGDDVGRSGHCQSRLREERRGAEEIRTTAGIVAGVIEVTAFAALAVLALSPAAQHQPTGTPAAGPGVTGKLGTIKRSDGTTQAVYNGHPLYTYIADTAPGQAHGNNLNLNGGLWHEVTVSG